MYSYVMEQEPNDSSPEQDESGGLPADGYESEDVKNDDPEPVTGSDGDEIA